MAIFGEDDTSAIVTDPSTPVGMVRLLITDVDVDNVILTDAQIEAFLTSEGANVKRAAALALNVIATSELLLAKKFSTQDLSVDGPAVAASLRASADALRAQALLDGDSYGIDTVALWSFDPPPRWANTYL